MTTIQLATTLHYTRIKAQDGDWRFVLVDGLPCVSEHRADLRPLRDALKDAGFTAEIQTIRFAPKGETQDARESNTAAASNG